MAKTQRKAIKIKRCELEVVTKRRLAVLDKTTLLEKGIKIPLNDSYGHKKNKIMINMLNGWRIKRILLRKKIGLLKQGLFFCF
jgi:hypothetical protein